jgi:hypothetical protein
MLFENESERTEKLWGIVAVLLILLAVLIVER